MRIHFLEQPGDDHVHVLIRDVVGSEKPLFAVMRDKNGNITAQELNLLFKELERYVTFTATKKNTGK